MNFQAVEQANGNKVTIFGTFTEIGGVQYTPQQKAKAICKIRDTTGIEHKVHIYQGIGELPTPQNLNQRCQFTISTFQGNYKGQPYIGYSGFWNSNAQVAPHNTQQAPQATNSPQSAPQGKKDPDWDAIAEGKVRHGILCAMLSGGISVDYEEVLRHTTFVMTGKNHDAYPDPDPSIQNNPDYVGDNPRPPADEDIPF